MTDDRPGEATLATLGACPCCDATVPRARLLAQYRVPDAWPRLLAECPRCGRIVSPV